MCRTKTFFAMSEDRRRRASRHESRGRQHGADWRAMETCGRVQSKPPRRHAGARVCGGLADSSTTVLERSVR